MKRPYSQYTLNMTFEDNLERMFVTQRIVIHVLCLYYKIYATILFGKILEDFRRLSCFSLKITNKIIQGNIWFTNSLTVAMLGLGFMSVLLPLVHMGRKVFKIDGALYV